MTSKAILQVTQLWWAQFLSPLLSWKGLVEWGRTMLEAELCSARVGFKQSSPYIHESPGPLVLLLSYLDRTWCSFFSNRSPDSNRVDMHFPLAHMSVACFVHEWSCLLEVCTSCHSKGTLRYEHIGLWLLICTAQCLPLTQNPNHARWLDIHIIKNTMWASISHCIFEDKKH